MLPLVKVEVANGLPDDLWVVAGFYVEGDGHVVFRLLGIVGLLPYYSFHLAKIRFALS